MMILLMSATAFGLFAALAPNWQSFLALRCLCGIALSGVPAVAMAYVAEEVASSAISPAIGLYIAGSAIGGMIGRLGAGVLVDWFDWRVAIGAMGEFSTVAAVTVCVSAPAPRASHLRRKSSFGFAAGYGHAVRDRPCIPLPMRLHCDGGFHSHLQLHSLSIGACSLQF